MRAAVWLPLFDELADPLAVARLAASAEEAGWDGLFVWDQLWWREPIEAVADPWITLAAVACATERLRIGPMVTPVARRRPVKLVKETATLDLLSRGRLTLGVGLGSDRFAGEYSRTGEAVEDRLRAEQLDESLAILRAGWSGEPVVHDGQHYRVDDVRLLPRPAQGQVPIWVAGFPGNRKPIQRAAQYDGFFPVNLSTADELAVATDRLRESFDQQVLPEAYDVVVALEPDLDPGPFEQAGATWGLTDLDPATMRLADVQALVAAGPQW
ncbi:LLM class flavin-dependent oxidoreductase [Kribbella sp. NBC_01505]|uniref:LLM class flavin-dependent oxidoreductase n=1 Tax=Kribbella sp. NBC_01505 TaxID=2903580 RepID=UPI003863654C